MNYDGRIIIKNDESSIPEDFRKITQTFISNPRPDVEATVVTKSHIIELKNGIIWRTSILPEDLPSIDKIDVYHGIGWFYVLECEDILVLISCSDLTERRRFSEVSSYRIGDFLNINRSLLFLHVRLDDSILTDGNTDFDTAQVWPPSAEQKKLQKTLKQRLDITRRGLESSRNELNATKLFIQETIRLSASAYNVQPIQESSLQNLVNSTQKKEQDKELHQQSAIKFGLSRVRVVGKNLIILVDIETLDPVQGLRLELLSREDTCIEYRATCLVLSNQDGRLYPEFCEKLGDNERGVGVLILPQSVLACFRSHSLSLSLTVNHNQGRSSIEQIVLQTDQLLNDQPVLNPLSTEFLPDFLAFFVNGIREKLEISTELGTLESFHKIIPDLGFESFQLGTSKGYFCRDPGKYFYGTFILNTSKSFQRMFVDMYCRDYSTLGTIVKLMRSKLPCDTKIKQR
ncbi:uncharacterized protein LOC111703358 isoform X4 [Eurytemora carolleeae]|uniref:uncharacterized protein LOC111703358 isoform X4 n=1 Tax=Eurytemora carolleeae TaxID=1294199 RepID=UPI000C7811D9|nr:uncharacterized protein LOC111703358 isoform X4 [Eurytemora carolleeae]|eukprot:XP_023331042.1 uncharacterized protein LOC111703358 isoform X4 [Eurytemora affinis]